MRLLSLNKLMNRLIIVISIFLISCAREESAQLSDGFEFFRNYGTVHSIARPDGRILVNGDVSSVIEANDFIVGLRIEGMRMANGFPDQPYGFFIYDKSLNELTMGLSKDTLIEILQNKEVPGKGKVIEHLFK